jgi:pimeloyl-ACP methyl ester carboxylesterase
MLVARLQDHDMPYISLGEGAPLVCIHGTLGDFRSWVPVLGPLSRRHRVIVPSLRRFFPEAWNGEGGGFTIPQHVADTAAFIEALKLGPVHLMGHSRGGHIAFRVAQRRPDLIRRLVLAEPGGELGATLLPTGMPPSNDRRQGIIDAVERIRSGDVEGGLAMFLDRIDGPGTWERRPEANRQRARDNARTLLGQINEQRQPYSKSDAQAIKAHTLLIGGGATQGMFPIIIDALAKAIPHARAEMIPGATHTMFDQQPECFCELVLGFLGEDRHAR